MLSDLWNWEVIALVFSLLIGAGFSVMSMTPPQFAIARVCYTLAALIALPRLAIWLLHLQSRLSMRLFITAVAFSAVGLLWVESVRWVDRLEQHEAPPLGLRLRDIHVSTPSLGQGVEVITAWENTAQHNIVAHNRTTVFTIGIADDQTLPIARDTEAAFESHAWDESQKLAYGSQGNEVEPSAQLAHRATSDPSSPFDAVLLKELSMGRARIYICGEQRWQQLGEEHGCEFCAWTTGDGRIVRCYSHNKCF